MLVLRRCVAGHRVDDRWQERAHVLRAEAADEGQPSGNVLRISVSGSGWRRPPGTRLASARHRWVVHSVREAGVGSVLPVRRLSGHDPAEAGGSVVSAARVLPCQGLLMGMGGACGWGLWGGSVSKCP